MVMTFHASKVLFVLCLSFDETHRSADIGRMSELGLRNMGSEVRVLCGNCKVASGQLLRLESDPLEILLLE